MCVWGGGVPASHGLFVVNLVLLSCLKIYVSKIRKMGGWSKRNLSLIIFIRESSQKLLNLEVPFECVILNSGPKNKNGNVYSLLLSILTSFLLVVSIITITPRLALFTQRITFGLMDSSTGTAKHGNPFHLVRST